VKRIATLLLIVLAPAWIFAASASRPFNLSLGVGLSFPADTLNDYYSVGMHVAGSAGFKLISSLELRPTVEYHSLSLDHDRGDGGGMTAVMFGCDVRLPFPLRSAARPYIIGGIGFAHLATNAITTESITIPSQSQTELYTDFGAGIDRKVAGMLSMFFQIRYVSIATDEKKTYMIPLTLGVRF
jgi:hypothetical protein